MNDCLMCRENVAVSGSLACSECGKAFEYFERVFGPDFIEENLFELARCHAGIVGMLERESGEKVSPVVGAVTTVMTSIGGEPSPKGEEKCTQCDIFVAETGPGDKYCKDCTNGWLYVVKELGLTTLDNHAEKMMKVQDHICDKLGRRLKATTIAAIYVMLEQGYRP